MTQALKQNDTKINMNDLTINHDAFGFGEFSWVTDSMFDGKFVISVQWLQWQGGEFRILFNSKSERDIALKALFKHFKPNYKFDKNSVYLYGYTYDFSIEKTISPLPLFELLKEHYNATELHLTPTSCKTKEFMYAENWGLIQDEHTTPIYNRQKQFIGSFFIVNEINKQLLSKEL